jgi:hypothetical protein
VTSGSGLAGAACAARGALLACFSLALLFPSPAPAQDDQAPAPPRAAFEPAPDIVMQSPRIAFADVDWPAARIALTGLTQTTADTGEASAASTDIIPRLNATMEKVFPNVASSPVPVLLPFDTATYLRDAAQGAPGDNSKYFSGVQAMTVFFARPSGYDAALSIAPQGGGLDLSYSRPVDV